MKLKEPRFQRRNSEYISDIDLTKPKSKAPGPGCSKPDQATPKISEHFDLNFVTKAFYILFFLLV